MLKKRELKDLDCRLPNTTDLILRNASSAAFLAAEKAELPVKGSSKGWLYAGWVMGGVFTLVFLALSIAFGYIWAWNSGLVGEVTTDHITPVGPTVAPDLRYRYTVAGKSYEKIEKPGPRFFARWSQEGASERVVYFKWKPDWATLEFKREPFEPVFTLASLAFVACLAWAGRIMVSEQKRLQRLSQEATHLLPGSVVQVIPGQGFRSVVYELSEPSSGQTLRGSERIGDAERASLRLVAGAKVAVLYADPKTFTLL